MALKNERVLGNVALDIVLGKIRRGEQSWYAQRQYLRVFEVLGLAGLYAIKKVIF